jgi:hypothetical protein
MSSFPGSPRLVKGGIVLLDPESGLVLKVIALQYNPSTVTRSLQMPGAGAEGGSRSEALRLKGPPVETIKLEVEVDATDALEEAKATAVQHGVAPQLAVLETLVYPESGQLRTAAELAGAGTLEIAPMESPLVLFIWSKNRVVPVRVTELSVTEEEFDPKLNPIRARVSLGLRVLNVDDLERNHRGARVFMAYLQQKELLAKLSEGGTLSKLGVEEVG